MTSHAVPTRGVPLRDRPTRTGRSPELGDASGPGQQRHVFVDRGATCHQGLVLQWAREPTGWVALTVYVAGEPGRDIAVQEWIPAEQLRPGRTV